MHKFKRKGRREIKRRYGIEGNQGEKKRRRPPPEGDITGQTMLQ